jgi:hypothetical protein
VLVPAVVEVVLVVPVVVPTLFEVGIVLVLPTLDAPPLLGEELDELKDDVNAVTIAAIGLAATDWVAVASVAVALAALFEESPQAVSEAVSTSQLLSSSVREFRRSVIYSYFSRARRSKARSITTLSRTGSAQVVPISTKTTSNTRATADTSLFSHGLRIPNGATSASNTYLRLQSETTPRTQIV